MSPIMHADERELERSMLRAARRQLREMVERGETFDVPGGAAGALARVEARLAEKEAAR